MPASRTIRGRDPYSGSALTVTYDDVAIRSISAAPLTALDENLPVIAPGMIDAQVNGYAGLDVNAANITADTIVEITRALALIGVTSWMPTVVTASEEAILNALAHIAAARTMDPITRSAVPSVHVEGPFISDMDGPRGVHDVSHIRPIDAAEVARWQRCGVPVGMVTVSPHASDATEHIARIRATGTLVSIGHTHATPEQVRQAVDAGASVSTHLGNGIFTTLPRHPNAIWTQLADDRLKAGIIADGHHLPMETVKVMLRAKTPGRAFLVSDTTAIAGSPPGTYETPVGGAVELRADGRLAHAGTDLLAGSASSLPTGFANVLAHTGLSLTEALPLVTSTPAGVMANARPGLGHLRPGAPADIVLLHRDGDDAGRVLSIVQSGRLIREPVRG